MQMQLTKSQVSRPVAASRKASSRPVASLRRAAARVPTRHADRTARPSVRVDAATDTNQQMQAAEKRWSEQVRTGKVRNVMAKELQGLLDDGWVLLDVRPPTETEVVSIPGSVKVPLFVEDPSNDLGSLLKKSSAIGMGGWWLGGTHMIPNTSFLAEVKAQIPQDANVVIGCQKGLRSLAACEQLSKAGYPNLAWINGGFDTIRKGDVPTTDDMDIRYAGIGGVSKLLGWTEVQIENSQQRLGGADGVIKAAAAILVVDLLVFGYEQISFMLSQK